MDQPVSIHNRYYVMRHGQSLANVAGVIVSDPKNGIDGYGLSDEGKQQALTSITSAQSVHQLDENLVIVSSDFKRCRETAEIVSEYLKTANVELDPRLRERSFGNLELGPNTGYAKVWEQDAVNGDVTVFGAESAEEVLERTLATVADLEQTFKGETILLVSHGDTLQILLTAFHNLPPNRHRELSLLETAEIRRLI